MAHLTPSFVALLKEAQFTKELLGSGATQIRNANYASKGTYFQAFTSLSTGLERIGKLCLILDFYITNQGKFPDLRYLKHEIGHNLNLLYLSSQTIIKSRSIHLHFYQSLEDPIHKAIVDVLHGFAQGDRYSNINFLADNSQTNDPITAWFNSVDLPIFNNKVTTKKKESISRNAELIAAALEGYSSVLHVAEANVEITSIENASYRTGMYEAVSPYRQLFVIQVIRYWTELLSKLAHLAHQLNGNEIPYFSEIFGAFYNEDSYIKTRKTWVGL